MGLSFTEFESWLYDNTKTIEEDIFWTPISNDNHESGFGFRVSIKSAIELPVELSGYFNLKSRKLSFSVIHKTEGRIYGLCTGDAKHREGTKWIFGKHKHRWDESEKLGHVYEPNDITAKWDQIEDVLRQFGAEANITLECDIDDPPSHQERLF